jgi:hypothetical protein
MAVNEKNPLQWSQEIARGTKAEKDEIRERVFNEGSEMSLRERLSIALALISSWNRVGEGREEGTPDESEGLILAFIRDIFLLERERTTLLSLLQDMEIPVQRAIKSALFKNTRDLAMTPEHKIAWLTMLRDSWEKHRMPERALLYCESIFDAICYEDIDIKDIPMPSPGDDDAIARELLRRKLFSSIQNSDPRWNIDRPRRALKELLVEAASQEEHSFSGLAWRVYEISYQYGLGLENRAELRRIAQDLLEMEGREPYEVYAGIFRDRDGRFRVDGASAFIKATQFRTRKPRGPAEEFRKRALESLVKMLDDHSLDQDLLQRVLAILRGMGDVKPLIDSFRRFHEARRNIPARLAFDEILQCWNEGLSIEDQKAILVDITGLVEIALRESSPDLYEVLLERIPSLSSHPDLSPLLRKNLKVLLADVDAEAEVRRRALALLGHIGPSQPTENLSTRKSMLLEMADDLDEEDQEPPSGPSPSAVASDDAGHENAFTPQTIPTLSLPPPLADFLTRRGKAEELKRECARMLVEGSPDLLRSFCLLFGAFDRETGRPLFDHRLAASRVFIEHVQKVREGGGTPGAREIEGEEKAKEGLFWLFFYRDCPDLVKMEAFELLNNLHYFDLHRADLIKKYALAFAKNALNARASSPPCRALSDLIHLHASTHSLLSLEGKSYEDLLEDLVSYLFKEKDAEKKEKWLSLLYHVSLQDSSALRPLLQRIHPLHYQEALDIVSNLVIRCNGGAGNLILDAVAMDFRDVRNHAIKILGTVLPYLSKEQVERGASLIIEKMDECFDEEVKNDYLDVLHKMDPMPVTKRLLTRAPEVGLSERKEFGDLLLKSLERLPAPSFLSLFESGDLLAVVKKFILQGPGDTFMKLMARRFLGLYRENVLRLSGKEAWEALQNSPRDTRWICLREISKAI